MTDNFIIHCVKYAGDNITLCGVKGMVPALDLFTCSWQLSMFRDPDDPHCEECKKLWRDPAMKMQKEKFELNREMGVINLD